MIFKFIFFIIPLVKTRASFDVKPTLSGRSLQQTNCITTQSGLTSAVNLWISDQSSAEKNYGKIEDWCTTGTTDFTNIFAEKTLFNEDISLWDASAVTSFQYTFIRAKAFNAEVGSWDVSQAQDFGEFFHLAVVFNQDLNEWDTSNVVRFYGIFWAAETFDQNLNNWDVSKGTNFGGPFHGDHNKKIYAFNGDISSWSFGNGLDFQSFFRFSYKFNRNLSDWDVSGVTHIGYIFEEALVFDQNIDTWDTSKVRDMLYAFKTALAFNQNLSGWDTSSVVTMNYMFNGAQNFNQCLNWDLSAPNLDTTNMFTGTDGAYVSNNCPAATTSTPTTSTPTTSTPSSAPTTLMETINSYNITLEEVGLDSSNLTLVTTYTVSDITNKSQFKMTVMDKNCNRTYGGLTPDTSVNDTSSVVSKGSMVLSGSSLFAIFQIDRFALETSVLTSATGNIDKAIAGELHFCLKAEIVIGGNSLNFRESNIAIVYDLSGNAFSITNNKVEKEDIITSTENAINIYTIQACRCGATSYGCLTNVEKSQLLNQDSLVHICLKPNSTDVRISNFYMQFLKDGTNQVDFETVRNSIGVPGSSVVRGMGTVSVPFKVTSRLISDSFANGATKFDIKGEADLQFNSNTRLLSFRSSDRILQVEDAIAGTAPYKMSVGIVENDLPEVGYFATAFTNIVGAGCLVLALSLVLVIYKKIS